MIDKILTFFIELLEKIRDRDSVKIFGSKRSSKWPRVRREFLKKNPICQACGGKKKPQVHHIVPVHVDDTLELEHSNLITLCDSNKKNCHFHFGHLYSFHSYNLNVKEDAENWLLKTNERP